VPTAARAKALHALGHFAGFHDQNAERALQEESLAIWRSLGDRAGIAAVLCSLGWVLWQQGELSAARASFEESLAIHCELGDRAAIAEVLGGLGWVAQVEGDMRAARTLLQECVAIWRELGDRRRMLGAFATLGSVTLDLGDAETARSLFEELLAGGRELNDKMLIAWGTLYMGQLTKWHEDYAAARSLHEESLAMWQDLEFQGGLIRTRFGLAATVRYQGDSATSHAMFTEILEESRNFNSGRPILWALACLGDTAADLGDWEQARARFAEGLKMCGQGERGDREPIGMCLHGLARLASTQRKPARAARLLGTAEAVRAAMGLCPSPAERREYDSTASAARAHLNEAEFATAWAEGEAMPLGAAIALALEEVASG
jgi:tetratricopeptide (TPR) repeat protein